MTWAIAMPGFPTGAVMLADVRVTWRDPRSRRIVQTIDGVLKVHPVARNLAVAFSGSVRAGFTFAHDLAWWLGPPQEDYVVSPARVAWSWQRRLRRIWHEFPAFSNNDAYRLAAPAFELERLPRAKATAIGSGSSVDMYVEMIESFADDWHELVQFSIQPFPAGPAGPIGMELGKLVASHPDPTVSSEFVLCSVKASQTTIHTTSSPLPGLTTPPLARTLAEFERLCRDRGLTAAAASATPGRNSG